MKIGFCGTMSVGKTTLVNSLKELDEFKDYKFATERSKYLNSLGVPLNTDSTFKGQIIFAAERSAELMQEKMITDRTIIDVMAFCKLSKSIPESKKFYLNAAFLPLINEYDIIFYVSPEGVKIEDNGVRETNAKYRKAIDKEIKSILSMHRPRFVEIKGTTKERINKIKETIFS
jgi:nicotinamide riboside kinase